MIVFSQSLLSLLRWDKQILVSRNSWDLVDSSWLEESMDSMFILTSSTEVRTGSPSLLKLASFKSLEVAWRKY